MTGTWTGCKQNGVQLDDVILPPWAKGDAREFIRLHRQVGALIGRQSCRVKCGEQQDTQVLARVGVKQHVQDSAVSSDVFWTEHFSGSSEKHEETVLGGTFESVCFKQNFVIKEFVIRGSVESIQGESWYLWQNSIFKGNRKKDSAVQFLKHRSYPNVSICGLHMVGWWCRAEKRLAGKVEQKSGWLLTYHLLALFMMSLILMLETIW